jgi:TetR/AcrR family transcriptional repressor of nem operon
VAYGDAQEALLNAGVALLREGGYEHAGTNAILERAGVPRGSFYHHFENKHQFVLAVATRWYEDGALAFEPFLMDETRPPLARLHAYFQALIAAYVQEGCKCGCLLGMLGQELSGRDEAAREALSALFQRWRDSLTACLRAAQDSGDLDASESPEQLSAFIINAWEGALIQMKTQRSDAPLNTFMDIVFRKVLRS